MKLDAGRLILKTGYLPDEYKQPVPSNKQATMRLLQYIAIFFLVAANVGCDQISKTYVRENIQEYERIPVVEDHFTLMKVENRGAFFGLGEDLAPVVKKIVLNLLPSLAILIMFGLLFFQTDLSTYTVAGLSFTIGGGIGNIIDRVAYGSVTDFMHMDFGLFQTGIFNMADVSIMVGLGLILLGYVKGR